MQSRRTVVAALTALALGLAAPSLAADAWPSRTLRIIVPNVPGGSSDIIARVVAQPLGAALGVPVIVENKPGANGNLGAAAVAQSTDGNTVLLCDLPSLAISPSIYKNMPYDLAKDLQGVAMLAYSPHLLVVNSQVPANNLKELVALSKKQRLNVALPGTGTSNHLATVQLAQATGIQWTHVPYKGGAQALTDTVAGQTQVVLNGMLATLPMTKSGQLRVIAVSSKARSPLLPNVATIAEQGVPGFESGTYQGVMAPAKMPKENVARLNAELVKIVQSPAVRDKLKELGADVVTMNPAETTEFVTKERSRWEKVVKDSGTSIEGQ
ncbi:MAG TPA: tripartite tricarboxylate transporter substrate binding protein [Casimicrobiaceae bacterium]|nr:tripartite tricarboxylate transporter substrate binding protein [Casimicrobiaceae bacterium]